MMGFNLSIAILLYFPVVIFSDDGICTKTIRIPESRLQSYTYTYRQTYKETCRWFFKCKKSRIAYRTGWRHITDYRTKSEDYCCPGYIKNEFSKNNLVCEAVCTPSCINSQCVKPGKCSCNRGYVSTSKKNVCSPQCDSNCFNGKCTGPNVCTCNFGYRLINNICTPICTEVCVNATCTAPDTCSCLTGYRSTENSKICSPYCSSGCPNGRCLSPETCTCDIGYEHVEGRCVPVCEGGCGTGTCTSPGVCTCSQGHELKDDNKCTPHCNSCDNGDCVAPDVCHCHTGYNMTHLNICEPVCENECINGLCTAPNTCTCAEGYSKIEGQCQPICNECVNGYCIAPQKCKCLQGYIAVNSTYCFPVCEPVCDHRQFCKAPNICDCLSGYKKDNETCIPMCKNCTQACVAPDICECPKGYEFISSNDSENECIPLCEKCQNGSCVGPEICQCETNYQLVDGNCYPLCDNCETTYFEHTTLSDDDFTYTTLNDDDLTHTTLNDEIASTEMSTALIYSTVSEISESAPCVTLTTFKADVELDKIKKATKETNSFYGDEETFEKKDEKSSKNVLWIYVAVGAATLVLIAVSVFAATRCVKRFRGSFLVEGNSSEATEVTEDIEILYSSANEIRLHSHENIL